jgi:hypothetical protein
MFPGLVVMVLATVAVVRDRRRDSGPVILSASALVVTGLVLSWGPEGARVLYAALHDNVYGFQAIRAPARFAVIAMLGVVLLAAVGIRTVRHRSPQAAWILIGLVAVEYLNVPLTLAAAPPLVTPVGQWLKQAPREGAVVHLPLTGDFENTPFMVQSLEHGRPIVNGYSGQRPAFFSAIVEALADVPAPEAMATLKELDVAYVVSSSAIAGAGNPQSPLVERARLADAFIYELRWTPAAEAALHAIDTPAPPPPGSVPFAAGEVALYEVHWDSGPLALAAGHATLRVLGADAGAAGWEFEATAETAEWISSFFQARDRFVTRADSTLAPLEHVRQIREGRRQLDRAYVFDRAARMVRVGNSPSDARRPDAMALPLASVAARDAVTALYYVRTLAFHPGEILSVPINEAGTNLVLQIAVGERETLEIDGDSHPAVRLEPRLMRRIERRRPLAMTVWISEDDRRVPLRVAIEAGFGRVRADLVDYRRD